MPFRDGNYLFPLLKDITLKAHAHTTCYNNNQAKKNRAKTFLIITFNLRNILLLMIRGGRTPPISLSMERLASRLAQST